MFVNPSMLVKNDTTTDIMKIWEGLRRAIEPFSFKRTINGVFVEFYVFNRLRILNSGKIINPALIAMIEKNGKESYYSLSKVSIPSDLSCYNYRTDSDKTEVENFIIRNLKLRDFSMKAPDYDLGPYSSELSLYASFFVHVYDIVNPDYAKDVSRNIIINTFKNFFKVFIACENSSTENRAYGDRLPVIPSQYNIEKRHIRSIRELVNPYSHPKEDVDVEKFLKDHSLIESLHQELMTFTKNIPIDWKFFCDLNKLKIRASLQDNYTWYANAPEMCVSHNGVEKIINPRKEFFYAFPNFGVIHSMMKELEHSIDSGERMIPVLTSYFNEIIQPYYNKNISEKPIKILAQSFLSMMQGDANYLSLNVMFVLEALPKKMSDMVRYYNNYSLCEQQTIESSFYILSRFYAVLPNVISKQKCDLIEFGMNIAFQSLGKKPKDVSDEVKNEIRNTIKTMNNYDDKEKLDDGFVKDVIKLMAVDNKQNASDLINDTSGIFAKKVFLPIMANIAGLHDPILKTSIFNYAKEALCFFLVDCKKSIDEMFYINKIVHDERDWFSLAGVDDNAHKCITDEQIKDNEGELHEQFNIIRSDKYRDILELDKHADWMTLISESYRDKKTGFTIVPLMSRYDLIKEGEAMNNCVGRFGYDRKSASGDCRIFTILNEENKRIATLEIGFNPDKKTVSLKQIQGQSNRNLIKEANEAAKIFVQSINSSAIKVNWNDVLELTKTGMTLSTSKRKEDDMSMSLSGFAGYNINNPDNIRIAAEPWRQFMPKKYRDFHIESFKDIHNIKEVIEDLKSINALQSVNCHLKTTARKSISNR